MRPTGLQLETVAQKLLSQAGPGTCDSWNELIRGLVLSNKLLRLELMVCLPGKVVTEWTGVACFSIDRLSLFAFGIGPNAPMSSEEDKFILGPVLKKFSVL